MPKAEQLVKERAQIGAPEVCVVWRHDALSWVSDTVMERMPSASGNLLAGLRWGKGSEEGGRLMAHRGD